MALAALQARKKAREEAARMEIERSEAERIEDEKQRLLVKKRLERSLLKFEKAQDEEKRLGEEREMVKLKETQRKQREEIERKEREQRVRLERKETERIERQRIDAQRADHHQVQKQQEASAAIRAAQEYDILHDEDHEERFELERVEAERAEQLRLQHQQEAKAAFKAAQDFFLNHDDDQKRLDDSTQSEVSPGGRESNSSVVDDVSSQSSIYMDVDEGFDGKSIKPQAPEKAPLDKTPVQVFIGSGHDRQRFDFLTYQLTTNSGYFRESLSHNIDIDEEQMLVFPDFDPSTFKLFFNFARFGKVLSSRPDDLTVLDEISDYHYDKEWIRLSEAWLLADRILSTNFKDAIVDAIALKVNQTANTPIDMYRAFYTPEAPRECGIKKLLVDLALCEWDKETLWREDLDDAGFVAFLWDIQAARDENEEKAARGEEIKMPCLDLGCDYHDHVVEGKACYREALPDLWI